MHLVRQAHFVFAEASPRLSGHVSSQSFVRPLAVREDLQRNSEEYNPSSFSAVRVFVNAAASSVTQSTSPHSPCSSCYLGSFAPKWSFSISYSKSFYIFQRSPRKKCVARSELATIKKMSDQQKNNPCCPPSPPCCPPKPCCPQTPPSCPKSPCCPKAPCCPKSPCSPQKCTCCLQKSPCCPKKCSCCPPNPPCYIQTNCCPVKNKPESDSNSSGQTQEKSSQTQQPQSTQSGAWSASWGQKKSQ
ncbi:sperm mitochondrial-associated cysteine-rich protein [Nannospalax galili]|uniref:sperm mitochondrial-associated cysteine-rich protein n=1 Tax=Nannospalax galili TaxID=1026970 RepID=UPI0004ECFD54|nr:sperm mitochondrial-associated cysteine-rich protein [Nannospalax galili]